MCGYPTAYLVVTVIALAGACGDRRARDEPTGGTPSRQVPPRDAVADAVVVDAAPPPAAPRAEEVLIPGSPKLPAFYLDREEATISGYNECIAAGSCTATARRAELGKDPRVSIGGVTFDQARAYCAWRGKRLPSPDEWRRAAYGDDARKFPWGDAPPTCDRVWMRGCKDGAPTQAGRPA